MDTIGVDPFSRAPVRSDCASAVSRQDSGKKKGLWGCFSCTSVDGKQKSEPYTRKSLTTAPDVPVKKRSQGDRSNTRRNMHYARSVYTSSAPKSKISGYSGTSSTGRDSLFTGLLLTTALSSSGNHSSSGYSGRHDDCGFSSLSSGGGGFSSGGGCSSDFGFSGGGGCSSSGFSGGDCGGGF